ncbi:MAG TPA: biotin/lipoyl-containing protein, partial [Aquabacterium sp.]|nr:biotin/lipoyl-containing protein [Aquabacterium sp.]
TLQIEDQTLRVTQIRHAPDHWTLSWDAVTLTVRPLGPVDTARAHVEADVHGERLRFSLYRHDDELDVFTAHGHARVHMVNPLLHGDAEATGGRLTAQMPGKVVALLVQEGQLVKQGDALAVTEAMKMEHTLTAPHDGTVSAILCAVGDQVAEGVELLKLELAA